MSTGEGGGGREANWKVIVPARQKLLCHAVSGRGGARRKGWGGGPNNKIYEANTAAAAAAR